MEQACPHALTTATMKSIIGKKTHHIRLDVKKNLHMRLPNTPAMDKSIETFAAQSISSWHTSVFDPFVKSKLNELYIFSTLESTQSGLHRIIKKTVRVIITGLSSQVCKTTHHRTLRQTLYLPNCANGAKSSSVHEEAL